MSICPSTLVAMCWQDCGLCIEEGLSLGNLAVGVSAWSAVDVVRSGCSGVTEWYWVFIMDAMSER